MMFYIDNSYFCRSRSGLDMFRSIDMWDSPTLYPVGEVESVEGINVNSGESDIDIWSLLKKR